MTQTTMEWRRSKFCASGACVEVAFVEDMVALRDGKDPARNPIQFTRVQWEEFVRAVKAAEFDWL